MPLELTPTDCINCIILCLDFPSYVRLIKANRFFNKLLMDPLLIVKLFKIPANNDIMRELKCKFKYFVFVQRKADKCLIGKQYINKDFNKFTLELKFDEIFCQEILDIKDTKYRRSKDVFNFGLSERGRHLDRIGYNPCIYNLGLMFYLKSWTVDIIDIDFICNGRVIGRTLINNNQKIIIKTFCDLERNMITFSNEKGVILQINFDFTNKEIFPIYNCYGRNQIKFNFFRKLKL